MRPLRVKESRRLKGRVGQLEAKAATPDREPVEIGDVRVEEGDNRVRVIFPGKPAESVRAKLKSEGAWQRMSSQWAWDLAQSIAREVVAVSP